MDEVRPADPRPFWAKRALPLLLLVAAAITFLAQKNFWMGSGFGNIVMLEATLNSIVTLPQGLFFITPLPVLLGSMFGSLSTLSWLAGLFYLGYVLALVQQKDRYLILAFLPLVQVFAWYQDVYALVFLFSVALYYHTHYGNRSIGSVFAILALLSHAVVALPLVIMVKREWFKTLAGAYVLYVIFVLSAFPARGNDVLSSFVGPYGLFTPDHLIEWVILISMSMAWALFANWKELDTTVIVEKQFVMTGWLWFVAAGTGLAMSFVLLSHQGLLRDWAFFSMAVLPVTFALLQAGVRPTGYSLILSGLIMAGWIGFNAQDRTPIMMRYMTEMPQYTPQFRNGMTKMAATVVLLNEVKDTTLARQMFVNGNPPAPVVEDTSGTIQEPEDQSDTASGGDQVPATEEAASK